MHPAQLHPYTVYALWGVAGVAMAWANYRSVTQAWAQASALHPRKNVRFFASFVAREQLAYAKKIPILLAILVASCAVAVIVPWA